VPYPIEGLYYILEFTSGVSRGKRFATFTITNTSPSASPPHYSYNFKGRFRYDFGNEPWPLPTVNNAGGRLAYYSEGENWDIELWAERPSSTEDNRIYHKVTGNMAVTYFYGERVILSQAGTPAETVALYARVHSQGTPGSVEPT
jgi:hypothetical protein